MGTQIKINLEQAEYSALLKAALNELRNPADQARFILRAELEHRGLLRIPLKKENLGGVGGGKDDKRS